jgi:L-methionine (R)-S-oxide reductase
MDTNSLDGYWMSLQKVINNHSENAPQAVVDWIQKYIPHYDWVGFYLMNHREQTLHLGPYAGAPTDHTTIPFGKGICGQVAVSGNTYLTGDVTAENNYIACSLDTKSEIVVPMYHNGKLIGQIDVDSHTAFAFDQQDERFLTALTRELAPYFKLPT